MKRLLWCLLASLLIHQAHADDAVRIPDAAS